MNMLRTLYEEGYINKSPEQMRVIITRRLLREIRDESQDNVDNLIEDYTMDRITQAALLDLSDLLIDEMEIIDEMLDKIDKAGTVNQEISANIPRLSSATILTGKGYESYHKAGEVNAKVFNEWVDNRVDKYRLVRELIDFYEEELVR